MLLAFVYYYVSAARAGPSSGEQRFRHFGPFLRKERLRLFFLLEAERLAATAA